MLFSLITLCSHEICQNLTIPVNCHIMSVDNYHLTDLPDIKTACCTFFVKILKNIQICLVRRQCHLLSHLMSGLLCLVACEVSTLAVSSAFSPLDILSVCALEVDGISKPCTKWQKCNPELSMCTPYCTAHGDISYVVVGSQSDLLICLIMQVINVCLCVCCRQYTNDYKLETYLKVARLYLEDEDPVQAEAYINRASLLQAESTREDLQIHYKASCTQDDHLSRNLEVSGNLTAVSKVSENEKNLAYCQLCLGLHQCLVDCCGHCEFVSPVLRVLLLVKPLWTFL